MLRNTRIEHSTKKKAHEVFLPIILTDVIAESDIYSFKKSFGVRNQRLTVLLADILKVVSGHQEMSKEVQSLMKASNAEEGSTSDEGVECRRRFKV